MHLKTDKIQCSIPSLVVLFCLGLFGLVSGCGHDYPAQIGNLPPLPLPPVSSTTACNCSTGVGSSTVSSPGSSTPTPVPATDTLSAPPPTIIPAGGNFYFSTSVRLHTDSLPPQAIYEYSTDNGKNWQTGQEFLLTAGGTVQARLRVGNKPSRSRSAAFTLYYQRLLVIGNSIMFHGPAPQLGWTNSNGMAASAPEKDFVHLLLKYLQSLNPATTLRLQAGTGLELDFGKPTYKMNEFDQPMNEFKPDLIVIRLGENIAPAEVGTRNFEGQFRQFIEKLQQLSATNGQAVKIVTTTSVWEQPQADAVIRKVIAEKGLTLVDVSCMVGQKQYMATQYANLGVAKHPNDAGMQKIADLLIDKIR